MGLNWYKCGDLTDFLVEQDLCPLVVLKTSNGIVWVGSGVGAITFSLFRWFKFTLKPPYSIAHDNLRLAIWDTSFWTFLLKFGHKGP